MTSEAMDTVPPSLNTDPGQYPIVSGRDSVVLRRTGLLAECGRLRRCSARFVPAPKKYMAKRLIVMLMVVAAIVGGLGFLKFRQIQVATAEGASFQSPPTAVTTVIAERETWPTSLTGSEQQPRSRELPECCPAGNR
jgi:hypothetical protein